MSAANLEGRVPTLAPAFGRNVRKQSDFYRRRVRSRPQRKDTVHGSAPPSLSATVTTFPSVDTRARLVEVWSLNSKVGRSASCCETQRIVKRVPRNSEGEYFCGDALVARRGSVDSLRDSGFKMARVGAWATPQHIDQELDELKQMCGLASDNHTQSNDCSDLVIKGRELANEVPKLAHAISPTDTPCEYSAGLTVSTFDTEATAVETRDAGVADSMRGVLARRLRRRPGAAALRRNTRLKIPTALSLPGMFAIPVLSPACTALNSESVSASGLASPVLCDMQLHTSPASTSARDMLSRLAGYGGLGESDTREDWGLFVSECLKRAGSIGALSTEPAGDAEVPSLPSRWFAGLAGSAMTRMRALVARGVPDEYRRQVWMECSGALDVAAPSGYARSRREEIELDVRRAETEPGARRRLEHVLYGFVTANPRVGYCQGMDKIARGLLHAGLSSDDALAMLCATVERVLPSDMFRPPMLGLQVDQLVLHELTTRRLPRLAAHLQTIHAPLAPVTVAWFLALFVDCLPNAHRLRVWDMLFVRGYTAMFDASLGVLSLCLEPLLRCSTPAAVYTLLQRTYSVVGECVDADEFGLRVFAVPGVSPAEITEIRSQVWPN
ncbi:hypothetical protein J3F82_000370 [Coemansia sp. RSA 637]|nr:hypothetical protein J3F82_000370 [Coemansia sp. RSA 637]